MNTKEKKLASEMLKSAANLFGNHGCNDVDESFWKEWSINERREFVKDFMEWNGDLDEYDENYLYIPDYALMEFLAHKLFESSLPNEKV